MENMKKVAQLLDNIRNVGSTNAKAFLLDEYVNSENGDLLKNVLVYCYDPFRMFGLTLPTLEKTKPKFATMTVTTQEDIFKLLDELYVSNINDSLRERAKMTLMAIEDETTTEMVQGIMCKDLKIGMNIKSINKVCPGLLPEFNVQLAESLAKQKDGSLYGQQIWITPKLDGFRIIVDVETNKAYTRKGQEYEGIEHIFDGAKKLSDMLQQLTGINEPFILDGELVHEPVEGKTSGELYSMTSSLARKKGRVKEKMKLRFNVFDFVPRSQFLSGKTTICYGKRRAFLDEAFMQDYRFVVDVPCLYHGAFDMDIVNNLLKEIEADGGEGLMINLNAPYQTKRTKDVLKVKSFFDADLLVLDVYDYTLEVMNALKFKGISPEWVQIGNEIPNGMLWPEGSTKNFGQLSQLLNSGYEAVKAVCEEAKVIIHLDQGDDRDRFVRFFDNHTANGGKYDVIGVP